MLLLNFHNLAMYILVKRVNETIADKAEYLNRNAVINQVNRQIMPNSAKSNPKTEPNAVATPLPPLYYNS